MQFKDWFIVNFICIGHSIMMYYKKKNVYITIKKILIKIYKNNINKYTTTTTTTTTQVNTIEHKWTRVNQCDPEWTQMSPCDPGYTQVIPSKPKWTQGTRLNSSEPK